MTELDQALDILRKDVDSPENQSSFYNLFLNTNFFIPSITDEVPVEGGEGTKEVVMPLIVDAEGMNYLMLFDTEERLEAWAEKKVPFMQTHGHMVVASSPNEFYWAMNFTTEYGKQFVPDEIAWLKKMVSDNLAGEQEEAPDEQAEA
jgi:hypothetical protein